MSSLGYLDAVASRGHVEKKLTSETDDAEPSSAEEGPG